MLPSCAYPWTPFLGGLLLNCLVCRCLNLGGPFLGVTGPPVTLVADRISALGGSRLMARQVGALRRLLLYWVRPLALGWQSGWELSGPAPSRHPHCHPAPGPRLTQTPLPMASRRRLHPPTLGRCSLHLNPARTPCLFSFTTACSSDTARPLLTLLWLCPQAPARLPVYTAVFLYPWGVMPHPTSPQMPWCPRPRTALNLLASDICNLLGTGLALWPVGLRDRAWDG